MRRTGTLSVALATLMLLASCAQEAPLLTTSLDFPGAGLGKADAFGRQLAGIAAPYEADHGLDAQGDLLRASMAFRRQVAWDVVLRVVDPVPLLGLTATEENTSELVLPGGVPNVARFQTWYGVDDFKRMFQKLFQDLGPDGRAQRAPFSEEALADVIAWNATAADRSERWPLERFLKHVKALGLCPPEMPDDECALSLQSKFSGATAGNARITYSPGTMLHLLRNYGAILSCLEGLSTLSIEQSPDDEAANFTYCFEHEFPADAVLIKAQWVRSDFERKLPAYDTDAASLSQVIGEGMSADWAAGAREADPGPEEILSIRLRNGDSYRLSGLHIMTKELRHWLWITLWWSDQPNVDFGADRPAGFSAIDPVWSHYKMAVTVDHEEGDPDPAGAFGSTPTLAAALATTSTDGLTWASNPYIEHGRGNARTNCIGCHQHGGSEVGYDLDDNGTLDPFDLTMVIENEPLFPGNGRAKMRSLFPTDYLWSTHRIDNLAQVIQSEANYFEHADEGPMEERALQILSLSATPKDGQPLYAAHCTTCHGNNGGGTSSGPSHVERIPGLSDMDIVNRLLKGKSPMPSWSHMTNQELRNVLGYLRQTFEP